MARVEGRRNERESARDAMSRGARNRRGGREEEEEVVEEEEEVEKEERVFTGLLAVPG